MAYSLIAELIESTHRSARLSGQDVALERVAAVIIIYFFLAGVFCIIGLYPFIGLFGTLGSHFFSADLLFAVFISVSP